MNEYGIPDENYETYRASIDDDYPLDMTTHDDHIDEEGEDDE